MAVSDNEALEAILINAVRKRTYFKEGIMVAFGCFCNSFANSTLR